MYRWVKSYINFHALHALESSTQVQNGGRYFFISHSLSTIAKGFHVGLLLLHPNSQIHTSKGEIAVLLNSVLQILLTSHNVNQYAIEITSPLVATFQIVEGMNFVFPLLWSFWCWLVVCHNMRWACWWKETNWQPQILIMDDTLSVPPSTVTNQEILVLHWTFSCHSRMISSSGVRIQLLQNTMLICMLQQLQCSKEKRG